MPSGLLLHVDELDDHSLSIQIALRIDETEAAFFYRWIMSSDRSRWTILLPHFNVQNN
jgi:hypothetical protein